MESNSVFDAVDGSFTGTEVPSMWAPLRLPRSRTPAEAEAWHAARAVDTVILNAILGEVVSAMARGDRVDLRGFGAFPSKFARREQAAIPEQALSCLWRKKHSQFLGLPKKCASGSTRTEDIIPRSLPFLPHPRSARAQLRSLPDRLLDHLQSRLVTLNTARKSR